MAESPILDHFLILRVQVAYSLGSRGPGLEFLQNDLAKRWLPILQIVIDVATG